MSQLFTNSTAQENSQPWQRLPEENNRWYSRFTQYLALGAGRSVRAAYNQEKGNDTSKPATSSWSQAAKRFDWEGRAMAYDAWQHRGVLADKNAPDPDYVKKLEECATLLDQLRAHLNDELEAGAVNDKLVAQYFAGLATYARLKGTYGAKLSEQTEARPLEDPNRPKVFIYMPEVRPLLNPQNVVPQLPEAPTEEVL